MRRPWSFCITWSNVPPLHGLPVKCPHPHQLLKSNAPLLQASHNQAGSGPLKIFATEKSPCEIRFLWLCNKKGTQDIYLTELNYLAIIVSAPMNFLSSLPYSFLIMWDWEGWNFPEKITSKGTKLLGSQLLSTNLGIQSISNNWLPRKLCVM